MQSSCVKAALVQKLVCKARVHAKLVNMKGLPGHGVGARPAPHGAGEKGHSEAWFGGVRVSAVLYGCTRQYSCATRSFVSGLRLGGKPGGFPT